MMSQLHQELMEIRDTGAVDMTDATAVQRYACEHDMPLLASYLEEGMSDYMSFVQHGGLE